MAEFKTIARPYAKAVFEAALDADSLQEWRQVLSALAAVIEDSQTRQLIDDPKMTEQQTTDFFCDTVAAIAPAAVKKIQQVMTNFISVLCATKRLVVLPEIAQLYQQLLAEREGVVQAHVTSAQELAQEKQESIKLALEKRFNSKVTLQFTIDKSLLGGVLVRAGNWVMDGTVKERVSRLAEVLS